MDAIKLGAIVPMPSSAIDTGMSAFITDTLTQPSTCGVCGEPIAPFDFTSDSHADCVRIAADRRKAAALAAYETARAEWQAVRDQYADTPALGAVLDLHAPALGYDGAVCGECDVPDGAGGSMYYPWSCPTFDAIRDA